MSRALQNCDSPTSRAMEDSDSPTSRWLFTQEQLKNSPSRKCGLKAQKEFSYRQRATFLIQDMGKKLHVSQVTINTAIVYMQRFYMLHSFTKCDKNDLSPAALFLAAKVEEEPRAVEDVLKVCHACLTPESPRLDTKSQAYMEKADELLTLETILLETLGFDIMIEHPHANLDKIVPSLKESKAPTSVFYDLADHSFVTTFCLQYKPSVIACVCIHLAYKLSKQEVCLKSNDKPWWEGVDETVTAQLLEELTNNFVDVLQTTPYRATTIAKIPDVKELNPGIEDYVTPRNREELAVLQMIRRFYTNQKPASPIPSESYKATSTCDTGKISRKRPHSKKASPVPSKLPKMDN
ncbi:cyclin-T2-like [Bufo gargarizans]|uniref:cyclin-T2-like n=1 Tax=Bufo gargarizans TaxID=30331 RepID=UPI001CF2EC1E|nr:cyclin-T2-like [Bufo gargarizans]